MWMFFGNFYSLAIEPLEHISGTAFAVMGAAQIFISFILGGVVSQIYNGTAVLLIGGVLFLGLLALLLVMTLIERFRININKKT